MMIDVRHWVWKLDMAAMLCVNDENNVIIKFIRDGQWIRAKILHMPMQLDKKLSALNNGSDIIKEIIIAAEREYWKESTRNKETDSNFELTMANFHNLCEQQGNIKME